MVEFYFLLRKHEGTQNVFHLTELVSQKVTAQHLKDRRKIMACIWYTQEIPLGLAKCFNEEYKQVSFEHVAKCSPHECCYCQSTAFLFL